MRQTQNIQGVSFEVGQVYKRQTEVIKIHKVFDHRIFYVVVSAENKLSIGMRDWFDSGSSFALELLRQGVDQTAQVLYGETK